MTRYTLVKYEHMMAVEDPINSSKENSIDGNYVIEWGFACSNVQQPAGKRVVQDHKDSNPNYMTKTTAAATHAPRGTNTKSNQDQPDCLKKSKNPQQIRSC